MLLLVDGQVVLSAIGQANEALNWASFNVTQYIDKKAQIEIVDQNSGGWGHINADQFLAADFPAHPQLDRNNRQPRGRRRHRAQLYRPEQRATQLEGLERG